MVEFVNMTYTFREYMRNKDDLIKKMFAYYKELEQDSNRFVKRHDDLEEEDGIEISDLIEIFKQQNISELDIGLIRREFEGINDEIIDLKQFKAFIEKDM